MTERLNNSEIHRRIMDASSDLRRYLNLAPSLKPIIPASPTANHYPQRPVSSSQFAKIKTSS